MQKLHNLICDLCIPECSCDELTRTIRLITSGETTWEHNNLALTDCLCKCIYRITDTLCIQITEYDCLNLSTRILKCLG